MADKWTVLTSNYGNVFVGPNSCPRCECNVAGALRITLDWGVSQGEKAAATSKVVADRDAEIARLRAQVETARKAMDKIRAIADEAHSDELDHEDRLVAIHNIWNVAYDLLCSPALDGKEADRG